MTMARKAERKKLIAGLWRHPRNGAPQGVLTSRKSMGKKWIYCDHTRSIFSISISNVILDVILSFWKNGCYTVPC